MKIIDLILSDIVIYEKNISAVDYINQTIETKEKWNQINVLSMESMLGANCRMPLLNMSESYLWIEETSQRINEFSFGYIFNPILYTNKVFRKQVKACFKNTFGPDTNKHINRTLHKKYKSACISCFLRAWEYQSKENFQSVELCNTYNYWHIRLYWLFRYR